MDYGKDMIICVIDYNFSFAGVYVGNFMYICTVFQQEERPRESAFSLFRLKVNLDTSQKHKVGIR